MMNKLLQFKPDFLPQWLFWILLVLGASLAAVVGAVGLWVVFTQVDML